MTFCFRPDTLLHAAPSNRSVAGSIRTLLVMSLVAGISACSQPVAAPSSSPHPAKQQPADATPEIDEFDELDELDALDSMNQADPNLRPEIATDIPAPRWLERSFSGHSQYTITTNDSKETIKGETDGQASVLYKQERINVQATPYLSWEWKIRNTYDIPDERRKQGDDFPARIYVVVQTGLLPWETLAINYVWSSSSAKGDHWQNPFSDNAIMVVLNNRDDQRSQWVSQARNIVADFRRYHDIDITEIDGYAYMIDGDNSGSRGVSWVRDIRFGTTP